MKPFPLRTSPIYGDAEWLSVQPVGVPKHICKLMYHPDTTLTIIEIYADNYYNVLINDEKIGWLVPIQMFGDLVRLHAASVCKECFEYLDALTSIDRFDGDKASA